MTTPSDGRSLSPRRSRVIRCLMEVAGDQVESTVILSPIAVIAALVGIFDHRWLWFSALTTVGIAALFTCAFVIFMVIHRLGGKVNA